MNLFLKRSVHLSWALLLCSHTHNLFGYNSEKLIAALKAVVKKSDCHTGVAIYSFKNNDFVYTKNSNRSFMPASNAKLFVGLAALEILGRKYCFETPLLTDATIQDGILTGNVYLRGSGDPSFTSKDFEQLMHELTLKKIHKINGDFCIDREIFDTIAFGPGTAIDNVGESWYNPIGGLIIDHKAVALNTVPDVDFFNNTNNHAIYFDAAGLIQSLLAKYGIELSGDILFKKAPQSCSPLALHKSQPILQLISKCMKQSDNLYADCFFKKLGAHHSNGTGNWNNGSQAVKSFLQTQLNISPDAIRLIDGSGLSRYNLVSPLQIMTALIWAYKQPQFKHFLKTLPISGTDGTLAKRMSDMPTKVKAKTGTMGGISALSGYITTEDDTLAFVILNNGYISDSMYAPACKKEIEDALCRVLVEWKED